MATGMITVGNADYYQAPSGETLYGWIWKGDAWCYADADGVDPKKYVEMRSTENVIILIPQGIWLLIHGLTDVM